MTTSFVNSNDQLADIFTKSLEGSKIKYIYNKLGDLIYMLQFEGKC